jgi:hypothetical protein
LANDKEFLADGAKAEVDPLPGAEVDKVIRLITGTPAEVAARYAQVMAPPPK